MKCSIALCHHLDRKTVREWVKNKTVLIEERFLRSRCRKEHKNRELRPQMESDLFAWICQKRDSGICVNGQMIRREALGLLPNNMKFTASDGWLNHFLKPRRLALRRVTSHGRDLPADVVHTMHNFLSNCQSKFIQPRLAY